MGKKRITKFVQNQLAKNGALNWCGSSISSSEPGFNFESRSVALSLNSKLSCVVIEYPEYGSASPGASDFRTDCVVCWLCPPPRIEDDSEWCNLDEGKNRNLKQWVVPTQKNVIKIVTQTPKYIWKETRLKIATLDQVQFNFIPFVPIPSNTKLDSHAAFHARPTPTSEADAGEFVWENWAGGVNGHECCHQ